MSDPVFGQLITNQFGLVDVGSDTKCSFVDIDNDGDLDAFIGFGGTSNGYILYFINSGTVSQPAFENTSRFSFPLTKIGELAAPTFVDLDNDGDQDALVGTSSGRTVFYTNIGTISAPVFSPRTDAFGISNVSSNAAPALSDVDGDGDFDAFIGTGDGATVFFRNIGTISAPAFASESSNFGLNEVANRATPSFVDFDLDGLMDLAIGDASGHVTFFHNDGTVSGPIFVAVTDTFGVSEVGGQAAPVFADLDNDGDPDLFLGSANGNISFQLNGGPAPITFTPNRGGVVTATEGGPPGFYTVVLDVQPTSNVTVRFVTDGSLFSLNTQLIFTPQNWDVAQQVRIGAVNDKLFEGAHTGVVQHTVNSDDPIYGGSAPNPITVSIIDTDLLRGEPNFENGLSNPFGLAQVGYVARPSFADIDGDGDFDLFIGDYLGTTTFFENTGTFSAPAFSSHMDSFGLNVASSQAAPDFVDIDGDGDLDAFIGSGDGKVTFFRNVGSQSAAAFASESVTFGLTIMDLYATPNFADIDADGDPDAFVGSKSGDIWFFRNIGTATSPAFAAPSSNAFGISSASNDSTPVLADLDGDGDLDLALAGYFGEVQFFRNSGSANAAAFTPESAYLGITVPGNRSAPAFVDIDGDGDLDAFVGNNYGDTWFFSNTRIANSKPALGALSPINYVDSPSQDTFTPRTGILPAVDPDGDVLTFGLEGGVDNGDTVSLIGDYGTLTVNKTTGAYTFVPDAASIEPLGVATDDDFFVTASDGMLTTTRALNFSVAQSGATETTGNDKLVGTGGNNTFIPLGGTDTVDGLGGIDTISFAWAASAVTLNLALTTAQVTGGGGRVSVKNIENLTGSDFNDRLTGSTLANVLDGGLGRDTMTGGAGSDTYKVDNTGDVVKEVANGGTADTVISTLASYTLPANVENGRIGLSGKSNLTGNTLANVLNGGPGVNKLTGGAGADRFDFNLLTESGITAQTRDTLTDFFHTQHDRIDLSGLDANAGAAGNQAFTKLTSSAAAFNPTKTFTAVGQLYFDQTAHVLYANTLAGPAPEFSLKVVGTAVLVLGDFIL